MTMTTPATIPCYLRSERSPAFTRFCEQVYGRMLNQYGTADMAQIDLLLRELALSPGSHALDAGCGTGMTTEHLCRVSGARFTGVDNVQAAIERARARAEALPDRLDFALGSMDALEFPRGSFDAIVSIESLYFPKDLAATVGQFKVLLRPGGRMGLFYTHIGAGTASPQETKLGAALLANGLTYRTHDLTAEDVKFWQRAKEVGEALLAEAEAEGNGDLLHLGETAAD